MLGIETILLTIAKIKGLWNYSRIWMEITGVVVE